MKVRELIQELRNMDPNAEVHFSYNYGDYWKTTVAPSVESVDEEAVSWSDYHRMPMVVERYDANGEPKAHSQPVKNVVVLSHEGGH